MTGEWLGLQLLYRNTNRRRSRLFLFLLLLLLRSARLHERLLQVRASMLASRRPRPRSLARHVRKYPPQCALAKKAEGREGGR